MSAKDFSVFSNPIHLLAFGFGSGLAPKAPGTAGSLAALPFMIPLSQLTLPLYLLTVILAFLLGIYICGLTSKNLGVHDHGGIVWDEFVGMWITMIAVPLTPLTLGLGFLLFRFFDIVKPWPIRVLDQKIHGGLGIMLDDVIAGVLAWLVMQALIFWLPV